VADTSQDRISQEGPQSPGAGYGGDTLPAQSGWTGWVVFANKLDRTEMRSLVRGAASGDDALREIFDRTRDALTRRITDNMAVFGLSDGPTERLLARGWSAMVEEVVLAWVSDPQISKEELVSVLTQTLPAVLAARR